MVYATVWTYISASSGWNELRKKFLEKIYIASQFLFSVLFLILKFETCLLSGGIKVMNPQMPLWMNTIFFEKIFFTLSATLKSFSFN